MRNSYSTYIAVFVIVIAVFGVISYSSVSAKTKQPKTPQEKFSVAQQGQTPNFVVTNNKQKAKTVDLEFDLVDAQGRVEYSYVQDHQKFTKGATQTYTMGPLMLSPAGSPYHVTFSVFKDNKKRKLIEKVDSAGTFTVYH